MNTLGNSILELFALLKRMATEEYRGIKNTLLYLLLTFYGLCFLQLILDGGWIVRVASFIFWVGSVLLLFKIPSMARLAGLGEILELAKITPQVPDAEKNQVPGVIENQISVLVERLSEKLLFLFTSCCFIIPIYPIRNNPWIIVVFTMVATIVFLFIWRRKSDWVRPIGLIVSLIFLAINIFYSFPQLNYYVGIEKLMGGIVSAETAKIANETDKLRGKQRDEMVRDVHLKIRDWQKEEKNKGKEPPENFKKKLEAAKLGLTVPEYEARLKTEADAKAKAEAEVKTKSPANVPAVSSATSESWKLRLQRDDVDWYGNVELKKSDSHISIKGVGDGGQFVLEGKQTAENQYQGNWNNSHSGETFFLEFDPNQKTAEGWFVDSESHKEKKMWLNKS